MLRALLLICLSVAMVPIAAQAERLRVATYDAGLSRKGPGLALQALLRGEAQVEAAIAVIAQVNPDVLLLTGIDYDAGEALLGALQERLAQSGAPYPYRFAALPNSGVPTGFDVDDNGRAYEARDAQGFGYFTGDDGMAVLSRRPIETARDFSTDLWADLPGALIGGAGLSPELMAVQRLSTTAHWDLTLGGAGRDLHLFAYSATPPVFDGPEDRNGRRNHDETAFWQAFLDGRLPQKPEDGPFVILGKVNLDPVDGEGRAGALHALLADPRIQDPAPHSAGGLTAEGPFAHRGDPRLDTAEFGGNAGNLRVDYVLPSADLTVIRSGVFWPVAGDPMAATVALASTHRLVYVDLDLP